MMQLTLHQPYTLGKCGFPGARAPRSLKPILEPSSFILFLPFFRLGIIIFGFYYFSLRSLVLWKAGFLDATRLLSSPELSFLLNLPAHRNTRRSYSVHRSPRAYQTSSRSTRTGSLQVTHALRVLALVSGYLHVAVSGKTQLLIQEQSIALGCDGRLFFQDNRKIKNKKYRLPFLPWSSSFHVTRRGFANVEWARFTCYYPPVPKREVYTLKVPPNSVTHSCSTGTR